MSTTHIDMHTGTDGFIRLRNAGGRYTGEPTEAVRRFRDHKEQMREWFPGEVTNEVALSVILDVYALHLEREGREVVAE